MNDGGHGQTTMVQQQSPKAQYQQKQRASKWLWSASKRHQY